MYRFIFFFITLMITSTLCADTSLEDYRLRVESIELQEGKGKTKAHFLLTNGYEFVLAFSKYMDLEEIQSTLEEEFSEGTTVYVGYNRYQPCCTLSSENSSTEYGIFLTEKTIAQLPKVTRIGSKFWGFLTPFKGLEVELDDGSIWEPRCEYNFQIDRLAEKWREGHAIILSRVSADLVKAVNTDLLRTKMDGTEVLLERVNNPDASQH